MGPAQESTKKGGTATTTTTTTTTTTKPTKAATGVVFKTVLLATMALQNAALNLIARYSRAIATSGAGGGYAKTTLVLTCEVVKIFVAFAFYTVSERQHLAVGNGAGPCAFPASVAAWEIVAITVQQPWELLKLLIPSILYVAQNNLVLVAAENLEGPILAVVAQAKILTTAFFSMALLKKKLGKQQLVALLALFVGVGAVQLSQVQDLSWDAVARRVTSEEAISSPGSSGSPGKEHPKEIRNGDGGVKNMALGMQAEVAAVCISGFAGVYFEKVLKESEISVWVRNVHLAIFGAIVASVAIWSTPADLALVQANGFFGGYNLVVWSLVMTQAGGGLLVAAVVKYTDNLLKSFATSVAILLVCATSIVFLGFPITYLFFAGAGLTILSIFLYGGALKLPPAVLCEEPPLASGPAEV